MKLCEALPHQAAGTLPVGVNGEAVAAPNIAPLFSEDDFDSLLDDDSSIWGNSEGTSAASELSATTEDEPGGQAGLCACCENRKKMARQTVCEVCLPKVRNMERNVRRQGGKHVLERCGA